MQAIDMSFIVWADGTHICTIFNQLLSIHI